MILIGMFDSPFVRRVAISATLLQMPFEHWNWSVGKDFERIRAHNPLGRVPALILDDRESSNGEVSIGETLIESTIILDYLDDRAGAARALLPARGEPRRRALRLIALATGAVDKGIQLVIERIFRPADKQYAPWMDRCRVQMHGALAALELECARVPPLKWLVGDTLTQADITLGCFVTYVREAVPVDLDRYPALRARVDGYEALPLFSEFHFPFDAPAPQPVDARA
jgi:glutathione S-transferase